MRRTKIVATMGPSTDDPSVLDALVETGADVFRLNAAHAGPGELAQRLKAVRSAAQRAGREVGVLLDLAGPKVRIGEVAEGTELVAGSRFRLLGHPCVGDSEKACVTHEGFSADVKPGDRVLVDDGRIELVVVSARPDETLTEVVTGGVLSGHKGVNVPGVSLSVEPITRYDKTVLAWAQANEVDWIGQSFVRSAKDIESLREFMTRRMMPVVAKIEKYEAAEQLEAIVFTADAVMVARGDLAVETSPELVPVLQRRIVSAARKLGRPVVIATEMLDSMRTRKRPTRAEASDVANAVFEGADALMLSGETAAGEYPAETLATMARIIDVAERDSLPLAVACGPHGTRVQDALSAAAGSLVAELGLAAIVTLTRTGSTALSVARCRPQAPVLAVTPAAEVARRLSLVWGVQALVAPVKGAGRESIESAVAAVRDAGLVEDGRSVAVTAGLFASVEGGTDFIAIVEV
jgi:pyruvate kinase